MTSNTRTTLIVLSAVAAGLLLVGQFVNWFQTTTSFFGGSFSVGFNAWSVNALGTSEGWMSHLGDDESTWQTTLMAFAGPLMLAATVLAGIAILPLTQGKTGLAGRLGIIAGVCGALAVTFGFLVNYTQDGSGFDMYLGVFVAIAGTVTAFVAGLMTANATAGNVPGPTTPTGMGPTTRPPGQ